MRVEPLPSVSRGGLEPLLEEEINFWRDELCWDYRPAANLIRRYVSSGSLPGFVLFDRHNRMAGYIYYVIDTPVAYIGNLFVSSPEAAGQAYRQLLGRTLETLTSVSGLKRIESQLFPFNFDFPPLFSEFGFEILPRHFLMCKLDGGVADLVVREPSGFRLQPWTSHLLWDAARVIFDSYRESDDRRLCSDYGSVRGCLRFLRNLLNSPGCGEFCPNLSQMVLDQRGQLEGLLISSRISTETGMIPQISVARGSQGKGLGSWMLHRHLAGAQQRGWNQICLSVSDHNHGARRLYQRLGFEPHRAFHAFVWNQG